MDIEKSVIWATIVSLMDKTSDNRFPQEVEVEDFYDPLNQLLWKLMVDLVKANKPIDIVTISEARTEAMVENWLSNQYIWDIVTASFTWANLPHYISELKELRRAREVAKIWDRLLVGERDKGKILKIVSDLEKVANIGSSTSSWNIEFDDVNSAYELMCERMGKKVWWYSWWRQFWFLDELTRWIIKKQVVRIGAPSWVWKTQFVYNVIPELMLQTNQDGSPVKVLFFTLENPKEMTLTSLLCKAKGYNFQDLTDWKIEWDWEYLVWLKNRLYIVDDIYDLDEVFAKVNEVKPDVVILDYIGYIQLKGYADDTRYKEYAKRVVPFVKKNNLAWIDLSNLANDTLTNDEIRFKPKFYWASELVNNSDVNIMIMRNEEFKKTRDKVMRDRFSYKKSDVDFFKTRNILDVVITKNRWGSPFYETTYWVNQETWWIFKEVNEEEMNQLWAKFW